MSYPFRKTKKAAENLWGNKEKLAKAYVLKTRGFIQARKSGYYWLPEADLNKLGLKKRKAIGHYAWPSPESPKKIWVPYTKNYKKRMKEVM